MSSTEVHVGSMLRGGSALIALFALTLALLVDDRNPHPIVWPFRRLSGRFVEDFGVFDLRCDAGGDAGGGRATASVGHGSHGPMGYGWLLETRDGK